MIQHEKIDRCSVVGYDKDNGVSICYGKFDVLENAMDKAKELAEQVYNGELKRKCSDGTEEPMYWIEVYWDWNEDDEQIIWGS